MRLRNTYKNVMEHGMKEGILDSDWRAVLHFWRRMIAKIDAVNPTLHGLFLIISSELA